LGDLQTEYDRSFNGHYDFRALGEALDEDVLADAITAREQIMDGTAKVEIRPAPLPQFPAKPVVTIGRTNGSFYLEGIREA
jgi:hypothetical protein